jgi:hypothetical protein
MTKLKQQIFGWFDDPEQTTPSYDAGPEYAKRSYFYRTHRSCAKADPTHVACDGIVLDMITREERGGRI